MIVLLESVCLHLFETGWLRYNNQLRHLDRGTNKPTLMDYDDSQVYTFTLSAEDDGELIEELERAGQDDRLNEHIRNLLRLGHSVHLAATFSTNQESLQTLFSPFDSRVGVLEGIVNRLITGTEGSSNKGSIGEQIVIGHLSSAFTGTKGDQFRGKASEGHSGDITATMMIQKSSGVVDPVPAMIEAKLYENTMPSKEIDKFWDDLKENDYKFGLFISLNQTIPKQQDCIHIESRGGKYGILVYNEHQDQMRHLVAYAMMRELAKLVLSGKEIKASQTDVFSNLINDLNTDLEVFSGAISMIGDIERAADKILTNTAGQVAEIRGTSGRIRGAIEQGVARLEKDISRASGELSDNEGVAKLAWNNDVWAPALACMPNKMGWIMTALRDSIVNLNVSAPMSIEDDADKPTIVFTKGDENLVSMVAMSSQMQISIKYDGEIPEGVSGNIKEGMLIVKINQKKEAIKDVNWPVLGELMISAANGE